MLRRGDQVAALVALGLFGPAFTCTTTSSSSGPLAASTVWTHPSGTLSVDVATSPFALTIKDASGNVLAESTPTHDATDPSDEVRAYAALAVTQNVDMSIPTIITAWDTYRGADNPWIRSTNVTSTSVDGDALVIHVATEGAETVTVRLEPQGVGLHLTASVDASSDADAINRVTLGFKMHDADHFMGFGERFVYADRRGYFTQTFVQNAGLGQGEGTPVGPSNPSPDGPDMTYMPIPWFMDPLGFGVLLNGTVRTTYHLGDDAPDAWRIESWRDTADVTLFADPNPLDLVADLTAITGRPPAIADYVIAPRRRADPGTDDVDKLELAKIPTSVIDLDVHYFPNGGGTDSASMQALTSDMHNRGYKTVSYFCPFVADSWTDVFTEASMNGYLVKHADGTTYTVLDPPYNAGMVDFTNPAAVTWYQSWLERALDDGWDGWMYDFAEYTPLDAVMFDGTTGLEARNQYPILYQKAAFDLLQARRPGDYLIFVRSGFAGTGGLVPDMWGGDNSTDFDLAMGLPAALNAALNVGMSGVPIWGSDISGYDFLYNAPPDKEVYLRWTEVGALSPANTSAYRSRKSFSVTDVAVTCTKQNCCGMPAIDAGDIPFAQKQARSNIKRMLPYVRLAVKEAQAQGTPVMRHMYLYYPTDPNVYGMGDEYMYGDSLLVAPVVTRGQTSRAVYLPDAQYFDFSPEGAWSPSRRLSTSSRCLQKSERSSRSSPPT